MHSLFAVLIGAVILATAMLFAIAGGPDLLGDAVTLEAIAITIVLVLCGAITVLLWCTRP